MSAPLEHPQQGQWIALTLNDRRILTCRFVAAEHSRFNSVLRWEVDHGAYGASRDDAFIRADAIESWTAAPRPPLRLSFINPHGKRCFVGRYTTHAEADAACALTRSFAHDIRIEVAP